MTANPLPEKLTPQQRWWAFRAHLPVSGFWQKVGMILGGGMLSLIFVLVILPYLLPLGGLEEIPLDQLQDPNGYLIDLNDEQLYYTHQAGEGEAVILIHGFGGSSVDWREVMPQLEGYDVYAVDLVGFGLSEKGLELDHSHQAQADRLADFMVALGISGAHIVGHDMGGNVATHLAQRHPERVLSLTLIAPAMQYEATTQLPDWLIETSFLQRWSRILIRSIMPKSTEINLRSAAAVDEIVTNDLIAAQQRTYHTQDWDLSLLGIARDSSRSALAKPLQEMDLPVLILWGAEDTWLAPAIANDLQADFPNAEAVNLDGVGHLPMLENSQATADELLRFWRGLA